MYNFRGDKTTLDILSKQIFPKKESILQRVAEWISKNLVSQRAQYIVLGKNISIIPALSLSNFL